MIGRKGIEPSTALTIEFTAQPIIPTNGTFLLYIYVFFFTNIYFFFYIAGGTGPSDK